MRLVAKDHIGLLETSLAFDIDLVVPVDQDVGNGGVAQQRLERSKSEQLVEDVGDAGLSRSARLRGVSCSRSSMSMMRLRELGLGFATLHLREAVEVEPVEQS